MRLMDEMSASSAFMNSPFDGYCCCREGMPPYRLPTRNPVVLCASRSQHLCMAKPSPAFAGDATLVALGRAIRQSRAQVGMSQEALAMEASLDRSYMGGVERGEHNLSLMNLLKIADALRMKPSALLDLAER